jgi:hypothetical protein
VARASARSPGLFEQELGDALARIESAPNVPPVYAATRQGLVRRVFLPKARNHIYFVHVVEQRLLRIVAVWGGVRGNGPPLR